MDEINKLIKQKRKENGGEIPLGDAIEFLKAILRKEKENEIDELQDYSDEDIDSDAEESYMIGLTLPKSKFIGPAEREFHIRIKLKDAPVDIWRELVVPSNITLEMLAYVLINAMGWEHEHLYQYIGKNNVYYMNSRELRNQRDSSFGFMSRFTYRNTEKTTLEKVLPGKGVRLKFEYDFGDSWIHELWVKGVRDYAQGEEPVIKLLKAKGACPPEDCGGVWGYAELLELSEKKRKTADDKERLEWYNIPNDFDPEDSGIEWLQVDVDDLWMDIKADNEQRT